MPISAKGLHKLMEECGELTQIAAKKAEYITQDEHPDGEGSMAARMENEMGDVLGAIGFVVDKLGLDMDRIQNRAGVKYEQYHKWSEETEYEPRNA